MKPSENAAKLQARIKSYCYAHGMMNSHIRFLVAQKLMEMDQYMDASDLWLALRMEHHVSISSVYQALRLLAESGIAQMKCGEGRCKLYAISVGDMP